MLHRVLSGGANGDCFRLIFAVSFLAVATGGPKAQGDGRCDVSDQLFRQSIGVQVSREKLDNLASATGANEIVTIQTGEPIISNYKDNRLIVVVDKDRKVVDLFCS